MPTHFNAFISYRHCEPDATVAGNIQRQLERYRIPKAIQKATGIKKIDRIFRDKEELPLSSNLGDDIESALRNSDFLIVICSPRLMESTWCQREIALFLQDHPIERVLTVLAEGEPQDVVPEILRTDREPLSCDYRMSPRKAKEIELPRLAAAIVGCRYDDLRQRQRQYRQRRRTAILSAALAAFACLAVYYYRTSQEIQKNYEQSLKNQSKYLASEALEILDEGDRLTAIGLALEAVPKWEGQRPWVPEAEFALGRAVNAYGSMEAVLAINAFHHNADVVDYFLSPEGDILVSWDENSRVYVWDTQSFALLRSFTAEADLTYTPVLSLGDSRMLIGDDERILCLDYRTGETVWDRNGDICGTHLILSADGTRVATGHSSFKAPMALLDTATGETLKTLALPGEIANSFSSLVPMAMSPEGRYLAMRFGSFQDYRVVVYDLVNDTTAVSEMSMIYIHAVSFDKNENVLMAGQKDPSDDYSSSLMSLNYTSTAMNTKNVFCLDSASAQILWENSFHYYLAGFDTTLVSAQQNTEDGGTRDVVCVSVANICAVFDTHTGELLQKLEMPDSAVSCEYENGVLHWYLLNGSYASHRLGTTNVGAIRYFPEDLVDGKTNHGCYVKTSAASRILLFRSTRDESWTGFENDVPMSYAYGAPTVSDDYLVVKAGYRDSYNCYNLKERSFLQTLTIDEASGQAILGMLPGTNRLVIGCGDAATVETLDLGTGQTVKTELPHTPAEGNNSSVIDADSLCLTGNQLAYIVESYNAETETLSDGTVIVNLSEEKAFDLRLLNLTDGTVSQIPLPGTYSRSDSTPTVNVSPDAALALVTTRRYDENYNAISESVLLDLASGISYPLSDLAYDEYGGMPAFAWSGGGDLAVVAADGIRIWDKAGKLQTTIDPEGKSVFSLCFAPGDLQLMAVFNDGSVYRYNVYGTVLNRMALYFYDTGLSRYTDFTWRFTDKGLLITADDVCTLISTDLWEPYAYIQNFQYYDESTDCFLVSVSTADGMVLGAYQRLTTAALVEMAENILGENQLTEEQRTKYGLD